MQAIAGEHIGQDCGAADASRTRGLAKASSQYIGNLPDFLKCPTVGESRAPRPNYVWLQGKKQMLGNKNAVMLQNSVHPARQTNWLGILLGCGLCALVLAPALHAQKTEKFSRKLVYRENPGYPLTLREAHIGGTVRLEIVISAKGTVDQVSPLGGNPVLVEAASNAVKKWKYAPADSESKTEVEFTFDPRR